MFPVEDNNQIMHVSLPISAETILMDCDHAGPAEQAFIPGNNISLSISTDSREEADRLFTELSAGEQIKMPMSPTFRGAFKPAGY